MADTGAPWNIPYVSPTDNPRVYPAADEAQALAIAAGLTAAGPEGIGPNVVQTVKTDTFTTTSTSFVDITGLTVSITPSSATSKILVIAQVTYGMSNAQGYGAFRLAGGNSGDFIGDSDGSRVRAVFGGSSNVNLTALTMSSPIVYLDSPGVSTAVTYRVEVRQTGSGSVFVNRSTDDGDEAGRVRGASSITVIEVAV
jgi:hypothetical protein